MARADGRPKTSRFLILASVCVVVAAMYFAQEVLIPLALATLLCFLLAPITRALEHWGLPRALSVVLTVLVTFSILAVLGWVVAGQVINLADNLADYRTNIRAKTEFLRIHRGGMVKQLSDTVEEVKENLKEPATTQATQPAVAVVTTEAVERTSSAAKSLPATLPAAVVTPTTPMPVVVTEPPTPPIQTLAAYIGMALGPLGTAGIVIVFVFFMLLQREDLRDRIIRLVGQGSLTVTTQALDDAATRVSKYLVAQSIVNGTYGIAVGIGLWLIGVPNAALWGLLCAVLRFIPYIGPWIGAAFPLLLSLVAFPDYRHFVYTLAMFVVIELLSNNIMEPLLYGSSTGISAVAILVSAVFWTWLWGPIGLLLSTPLTVLLVVMGKYVPQLAFLNVLLGDQPVLEPHRRYFQRLLAMDGEEAEDVIFEYLEERPLEDLYDEILIPALALFEHDRHRGEVDEERQKYIIEVVRDHIERIEEHQKESEVDRADEVVDEAKGKVPQTTTPKPQESRELHILCLPAADEVDELVALMLAQVLKLRGFSSEAIAVKALASEMLELVDTHRSEIVFVSAMPPAATTHARYLCKRLTQRFPNLPMIVGLWSYKGDVKRAMTRIGCSDSVGVATSLRHALEQVTALAPQIKLDMKNSQESGRSPRLQPTTGK